MAGAINRSARRSSSAGARPRSALRIARLAVVALILGVMTAAGGARAQQTDAAARGAYVFRAAGGCSCHTNIVREGVVRQGAYLAGGRPLKTPFGIFYSPNITPDAETGIGSWSEAEFLRAMRQGIAPDGSHYFPVFPYTSFTKASDADATRRSALTIPTVPTIPTMFCSHILTRTRISMGRTRLISRRRLPRPTSARRSRR